MGAKGAVEVETILAQDSVEETMKAYEGGRLNNILDLAKDFLSSKPKDQQQRKAHVLLQSLRFITDYHNFRKNLQKRPPPTEPIPMPSKSKRRKVTFADL